MVADVTLGALASDQATERRLRFSSAASVALGRNNSLSAFTNASNAPFPARFDAVSAKTTSAVKLLGMPCGDASRFAR